MARVVLNDLTAGDYAYVEVLQDNLDLISNALDGQLVNENIAIDAEIDPAKIANGGAITQLDLTTYGTANKIPQIDDNGNITITGKIIFVEGLI